MSRSAIDILNTDGRFPSITLQVQPLEATRRPIVIKQFLSYSFASSVVVPVSSFSFEFKLSDDQRLAEVVRSGDIAVLLAGQRNQTLCTGLIDTTEMETDGFTGERCFVIGRDLMGQLEDNEAVSLNSKKMWSDQASIDFVANKLCENTRIREGLDNRGCPTNQKLFSTEPGESRLAALQRFIEPFNALSWMSPEGRLIVGRPNMKAPRKSYFDCNRQARQSNVLAIKSTRFEALVCNVVLPIWTGLEDIQSSIGAEQALLNSAEGPARLYKGKHYQIRAISTAAPDVTTAQGQGQLEYFIAGAANDLQGYAKRQHRAREHQRASGADRGAWPLRRRRRSLPARHHTPCGL